MTLDDVSVSEGRKGIPMEEFHLKPFEPVELTDDDLHRFGLSEEEMKEWREFHSDPANSPWDDSETLELARKLQLVFQEFDV